eukprot:Sspe_Gene.92619::Locus_65204_Transcript_1_1_Confidence_1.000_Length_837::g.92619::m.92619
MGDTCANCHRKSDGHTHFTPCPCKTAAYCSPQCQKEHLPVHKDTCPIAQLSAQINKHPPETVAAFVNQLGSSLSTATPQQMQSIMQKIPMAQDGKDKGAHGMAAGRQHGVGNVGSASSKTQQQQPQSQTQQPKLLSTQAQLALFAASKDQLSQLLAEMVLQLPKMNDLLEQRAQMARCQQQNLQAYPMAAPMVAGINPFGFPLSMDGGIDPMLLSLGYGGGLGMDQNPLLQQLQQQQLAQLQMHQLQLQQQQLQQQQL